MKRRSGLFYGCMYEAFYINKRAVILGKCLNGTVKDTWMRL